MAVPVTGSAWVKRFHRSVAGAPRLICFPHAGGSANSFHWLSQALSPAVEVLALQYPGRQERLVEEPIDDLYALVDRVIPEVRKWCDRPFALYGHSMGATLAFETAGRLEQTGLKPQILFVSGRRAPRRGAESERYRLDDEGLIEEIKRLNGTDAGVLDSDELIRMVLPTIRSDYRAIETYRYRPQPARACPVVALAGDADPDTEIADVEAWREFTTGDFTLHTFAGGHFFADDNKEQVGAVVAGHLTPGATR
ncbi:alpha/beta fold hydrolase [Nonomuraea angiospora]|uniref:thioesterase II family protein n=1 Tax=Nonomuraea angiospora TaxID=46172 RepID=UPI0034197088